MSAKTTRKETAAPAAPKMEGTTKAESASRPRAPRQSATKSSGVAKSAQPAQRADQDGRIRAIIDRVIPEVDCGRFAVKRVIGDTIAVEAHVFTDGHDAVRCMLRYRHE